MNFAELIVPSLTKTKFYLTGGFRTVAGMVNALNVLDGVGLGRLLCQEPYLCAHIRAGKVQSAVQVQLDQYDFLTTATALMMQIRQIGNYLQPINLEVGENTPQFYEAIGEYMAAKAKDTTEDLYMLPAMRDYNVPLKSEVM